ncbi:MAG: GDP-mannose 4,6-dehydratase [bacterium]
MKRAFITGITGQDGSYLAELLLEKGYEVWGLVRRSSSVNTGRLDHLLTEAQGKAGALKLVYGDLSDSLSLSDILHDVKPDEVYNLGAQSHVRISFDNPVYTTKVNALGAIRLLESIRKLDPMPRFYQASTSEMFGRSPAPQSEDTPFRPRNPYACSKVYAFHQLVNYREAYGLFGCNGILFNHESPRRGENFVTRKITMAAARIKLGLQDKLYMGNLDTKRDWGYAPDYVRAMWMMLQADEPDDYVVATGETHTVREFLECSFGRLDLDWKEYVEIDPAFYRPSETWELRGDSSNAQKKLKWEPQVSFKELVAIMTDADLRLARRELKEQSGEY